MQVQIAEFGSPEYLASVELRLQVLRIPLGIAYTRGQLEAEREEFHFVALDSGAVVGVLLMAPQSRGLVKMRQVAVAADRQGAGIGRALVAASEAWAARQGYSRIELHARETAVPFYERLGYAVFDSPFTEIGLPHRKMGKDL